ncbi:peptidoglycan/LPS O-acetylase OafA/YrhL [Mycobacterium frederiksbergense]|uniref:Peptidoglycan/LPS O-acetylase OafA/YrhL n=1 Tax=Mycolicibacterium frederiksbergense TaxID=117567 RepID=A0ABT6L200_9MYCO|nr:acyltransferase [Mycolicibacterium frederiksbergense]MDH6196247.1 peptidoglycan/LPS O-acetylase OafA/YrhL [Mycolicibacterium frederiksbergense]
MANGQERDHAIAARDASALPRYPSVSTTALIPASQATSPGRVEFVDSVRAFAALYVVVHHLDLTVYGYPNNSGPPVLGPLLFGHFGVAIFIVVSGFSLGLAPARRGWQLTRGGYREFMRRRAWRILPPYWAALAISVAVVMVLSTRIDDPVSWKGVATHFFLVQNVIEGKTPNGAFWSIAVEWQLYWIFPLLLLVRRRVGPVVLTTAVVTIVIAIGVAHDHGGGVVVQKLLHLSPQLGALFVYGLVAAVVITRSFGRWRCWGYVAVVTGLAVVIACGYLGAVRAEDNFYWLDLVIGIAVASGLAYLTARPASRLRRLLEWRPSIAVGRFSYSLYLLHAPLLIAAWVFLIEPLGLAPGAAFALMAAVVVPLIVAASYAFHRVFERPFMEYRSWAELRAAWAAGRPGAQTQPAEGSAERVQGTSTQPFRRSVDGQ